MKALWHSQHTKMLSAQYTACCNATFHTPRHIIGASSHQTGIQSEYIDTLLMKR
jgi:hypothetical protein